MKRQNQEVESEALGSRSLLARGRQRMSLEN